MIEHDPQYGVLDCGLRAFVIAPIAIAVALLASAGSGAGVILFAVAGIALVTGATGVCPTYTVLGISTRGSFTTSALASATVTRNGSVGAPGRHEEVTGMRPRVIGVALAGVGVLAARALAPRLHARLMAGCERMFEQMPDTFPPKRMMRGIEEIRANSARALALLEAREQEAVIETVRETSPDIEEPELAAVGAGVSESGG